jgi:hypothetical protein
MKKQINIKNKNILNKNFNKKVGIFNSLLCTVYTTATVLIASESIRYVKVFQCSMEFPMCLNVWEDSIFSCSYWVPFLFTGVLLEVHLWRLFKTLRSCTYGKVMFHQQSPFEIFWRFQPSSSFEFS